MKKHGNQTPTKSVILEYKKSLGEEAIALYKKTGREPYPWQEKLVKDLFAVNEEGLWVHSKFGYGVPRRNGKTEVVYMAELWGLFHTGSIDIKKLLLRGKSLKGDPRRGLMDLLKGHQFENTGFRGLYRRKNLSLVRSF